MSKRLKVEMSKRPGDYLSGVTFTMKEGKS